MRWRVYLVVVGLLLLLLATAGTTTVVRLQLTSAGRRLTDTLRPAQLAAANLTQAYVDEETGERGYLLTRDRAFLAPYTTGQQAAATATRQLTGQFADDPASSHLLSGVTTAADEWRTRVIEPELAGAGTLTGRDLVVSVGLGRQLFDTLRTRLRALQDRINELVGVALQNSNAAQTKANDITIAAAIAALLLAAVAIWQFRTSFAVPLNRLVTQVRRVSGGDMDRSVDVTGPLEVATVGESVEAMRVRILAESARSTAAGRQLARYEEAERIALSLGDTVIRQLFTTSLVLQSTASRHPATAGVLTSAIREIDVALRDLQAAIFELTAGPGRRPLGEQVLDLVDQLSAGLGAAPEVQLAGSLDSDVVRSVATDVIAVLRDVLGTLARRGGGDGSTISLGTAEGVLNLRITGAAAHLTDHGTPIRTLTEARQRAERLGGSCTVAQSGDFVTVSWQIPMPELPASDS